MGDPPIVDTSLGYRTPPRLVIEYSNYQAFRAAVLREQERKRKAALPESDGTDG